MKKKYIIISGCSGFIGLHLSNFFIKKNYIVYGLDRFSNNEIITLVKTKKFFFKKINLTSEKKILKIYDELKKIKFDSIWHLAANSDISKGITDYKIELNDTFITTINLVNLSKKLQIDKFIFSSSSAIFGNIKTKIHENSTPVRPISNYGAMKLSSESYIYASSKYFKRICIFRFPNVVGPNMTHGLIYDLKRKINNKSYKIQLLGDGNQQKPYLHVNYLIIYMFKLYKFKKKQDKIFVYNIGPSDRGINVREIANLYKKIINNSKIEFLYQKKKEGWVGDVIKYSYNNFLVRNILKTKIPSSKDSIIRAIKDNITQK